MKSNDTLFGRIKNGVLTISGNNASIRVDGGYLVISDGPVQVAADHDGPALPLDQRMVTCRFRRADCPIDRIVITRPDGFITFSAVKWLHGVGASLVQLDWDGTVLLTATPPGNDQPGLRRAQALAAGNNIGHEITREILRAKLNGQAAVAKLLGSDEVAALIADLAAEFDHATDIGALLAIEAAAATAYWSLWLSIPLRFARRHEAPEHWRTFGNRHSPLSQKSRKAASPGNAILNYLYAVLAGEMTIALTAAGLDPGIGIFHLDADRRASFAYDAMEPVRPYVDGWFATFLSGACFSKRDFYEEPDGTIRLTRPLTSHLAMTAAIWRPAAQTIAGWLARALSRSVGNERRLPLPMPALPAPKRTWQGLEPPVARTCQECGKALQPRQRKFCSEGCSVAFLLATTTTGELAMLPVASESAETAMSAAGIRSALSLKHRRHLALRRAWDLEHGVAGTRSREVSRPSGSNAGTLDDAQLRDWFTATLGPRLAGCSLTEIRRATGLSKRYAIMIRQGVVPHPRHYPALAQLVGVEAPTQLGGSLPMTWRADSNAKHLENAAKPK